MSKQTLFIVDDHKIVRDGLKALLFAKPDIQVIGEAASLSEAKEKLNAIQPDLLFVDLKLPDGNGSQFLTEYLDINPKGKCALLTADPNKPDLLRAQEAGVLGFLTKDIDRDEYFSAIDKLLAGKKHISAAFADVLMNDTAMLTPRELDVLKEFANGLTYKEIGAKLDISPRTVETHKNKLLEKFEVNSIVEMVKKAIFAGYIDE